ncbi:hypothetical protein L208DRAFT_1426505 [Tricholoma matsutake]|nr:hypothetical protein L208DRAFT_1426505 [Tricholoma matsutake 945]
MSSWVNRCALLPGPTEIWIKTARQTQRGKRRFLNGRDKAESERRDTTQTLLSTAWQTPNVLSVLLIIGGDVIQKALSQLSGRTLVPVAFSFGWVAYSFTTLMSVVGTGRLMPQPDYPAKVINAENGYVRNNKSWVLGRLLRDFERPLDDTVGLSITVFNALPDKEAGVPRLDWYWKSGLIVMAVQLGVAAIPCGLYDDWGILLMTAVGTILALATGALPQWRFEKWACRRKSKTVSLTGGNGTRYVMVIIGMADSLDLEDLAAAETVGGDLPAAFWVTPIACMILAFLWIVFLITVSGLTQNTWYLLAVGGIGMIQNVIVAGVRRDMSTSGIHLVPVEKIEGTKVMDALMDLEINHKGVGESLVSEFFPKLKAIETKWWAGDRTAYDEKRFKDPLRKRKDRWAVAVSMADLSSLGRVLLFT